MLFSLVVQWPFLRMGAFADSERIDILDDHQERGDLFELADATELYILNNIRRAFVIDGSSPHRDERPEIPKRAIHKVLFNAFCHHRHEDEADTVNTLLPNYAPAI